MCHNYMYAPATRNIWSNETEQQLRGLLPTISQKYAHPYFSNKVVAQGDFLSKICPLIYAAVHVVMLSKKRHRRSSTVKQEGLT